MKQTRKTVTLSALVALGLILSYVESLFPVFIAIPGVKLGLANTVSVFALYMLGIPYAITVSLLRVVLSSLLFGSTLSLLYSLVGAVMSILTMIVAKRVLRFSSVGVSALGGVFHNLGQTLAAAAVLENLGVFFYFPVLIVSGVVSGVVIGTAAGMLVGRLSAFMSKIR